MKKISLWLFWIAFFCCSTAGAWSIDSFEVNIEIGKDRRVTVEEKITADFSYDPHHGIYRYIPLHNKTRLGQAYNLRTKLLEVKSAKQGDQNWTSLDGGNLYVKIGNPDIRHREVITYTLKYAIENAVISYPTHDELYWNVTGNEWNTEIKRVGVNVSLPQEVKEEELKYNAFLGYYGGTDNFPIQMGMKGLQVFSYRVTRGLKPSEGMTIVLGVPKGILEEYGTVKKVIWFFQDNWPYGVPILMLVFLFILWWRKGKDPSGRGTIMVQYEPPSGMTPAEVGTLIDEEADLRDITANLVDLARRGYLTIQEESDHDFVFIKNKEPKGGIQGLKSHEKILMEALFSGSNLMQRLSALKHKFYVHLKPLKAAIYRELVDQHCFVRQPQKTLRNYRVSGLVAIVVGVALFIIFMTNASLALMIAPPIPILLSAIVSGLLLILFAPLMPQKTHQGVLAFEHIKGLEEYISRVEAETLQKENVKEIFERLLPFAMCLGLTTAWVKKFSDIYTSAPAWFVSTYGNHWNTNYFSQSLNRMENSSAKTFASVPRTSGSGWSGGSGFSGGGGYSGGGFGGGGGGSW